MSTVPHCDMIIPMLRSEFGDLWTCRPCSGGRVVHVQTPFSTPTDKLISLYIEQRGNEWIISDGGYLCDDENSYAFNQFNDPDKTKAVLDFLADEYDVQETKGAGRTFFYMKTTSLDLLSSRVSDVAAFVSSAVSALHCSALFAPSREPSMRFYGAANDYLRANISNIETNVKYPGIKHRFHAKRQMPNLRDFVVSYVSASSPAYFERQLTQSIVYTEMLWTSYRTSIYKTVTLIDNESPGFRYDEQKDLRKMLAEKSKGTEPILWGDRETLVDLMTEKSG